MSWSLSWRSRLNQVVYCHFLPTSNFVPFYYFWCRDLWLLEMDPYPISEKIEISNPIPNPNLWKSGFKYQISNPNHPTDRWTHTQFMRKFKSQIQSQISNFENFKSNLKSQYLKIGIWISNPKSQIPITHLLWLHKNLEISFSLIAIESMRYCSLLFSIKMRRVSKIGQVVNKDIIRRTSHV